MKDISQEKILRMVGLRDGAHLMRQLNAIQLSLEEQDGQMVAYWTEIQKDERQISLIAGRVSANETSIGQLQVTAQSLTASVSSLNTTVSGHTTKIASLELTDQSLTASVSSLNTTVGTHTTKIASLELTDQSLTASVSSLNTTVGTHTTKIASLELTDQSLTASVSSLNTTVGTHTTKIASLELTDTSISNRVTAIEGDYVKEAEISLMVVKDSSGYISNASIKADNILFTFTQTTNFVSGGRNVMVIDNSGNLSILGTLTAGCVIGNLSVDNSGNISGTGSVTTDNVVTGYKTQEITVPSTNNSVTDISPANGLFVFLKGSTSANTHYFRLPTLSDIRSVLGITSSSKFFCTRMIVINQSSAGECFLTYRDGYEATTNQPWKMTFDDTHRTGGDAVTQLAVGDYIEILLIYNHTKGEYRAYEVVHNN